jgi:hypothetical protein
MGSAVRTSTSWGWPGKLMSFLISEAPLSFVERSPSQGRYTGFANVADLDTLPRRIASLSRQRLRVGCTHS